MDTVDILNKEFSMQDFTGDQPYDEMLVRYKDIACNYARMENVIAVLSDLRTRSSYIYYGGFSQMLERGGRKREDKVSSIWEKELFGLMHQDDLENKHWQELCFYHFMKRQPKRKRSDYYLASKIRMMSCTGSYLSVLHRMFYVLLPSSDSLWLALCLYGPLTIELPSQCMIVNSVTGHVTELEKQNSKKILSARERQILTMIDKGLTSKEIARLLSISINTVSRHRQEILANLQVNNSIEACRIAKDLKLI